MKEKKTKGSIYVCHTYYHVYITILKELNKPKEEWGKATLVLSKMSINFEKYVTRWKYCRQHVPSYCYDKEIWQAL